MKLILASQSPRRKRILEDLGLQFTTQPSNFDEDSIVYNGVASEYTMELARNKVNTVAANYIGVEDAVIIGCDSVFLTPDGEMRGKPKSKTQALLWWKEYQNHATNGNYFRIITGYAVCSTNTTSTVTTPVVMAPFITEFTIMGSLSDQDIESLFSHPQAPLDCCGAFGNPICKVFIDYLDYTWDNAVGMSPDVLYALLKSQGLSIFDFMP